MSWPDPLIANASASGAGASPLIVDWTPSGTTHIYQRGSGYIAHPKTKTKMSFMEKDEQAAFVGWLRVNRIRHHAIINSGARNQQQGAEFKRQGLVPGVPDLYVFLPGVGSLAIEMKRANGSLSDVDGLQWDWHDFLPGQVPGWFSVIAFGKTAAVDFVKTIWRAQQC